MKNLIIAFAAGYAISKIAPAAIGIGNVHSIFVFLDGELLRQINYRTKTEAKRQYAFFKRHGILDGETGEVIQGATFELLDL